MLFRSRSQQARDTQKASQPDSETASHNIYTLAMSLGNGLHTARRNIYTAFDPCLVFGSAQMPAVLLPASTKILLRV